MLQNAPRDGTLTARPTQQRLIERRFGDAIRELFGVDIAALTGPEAGYLGNFRDADAIRTRAAAASRKRRRRLSAKGLSGGEDPSIDSPHFSRTNERSSQPSESTPSPARAIADKIQDLNAIMAQQEGLANGFQYSSSGDQGVSDAYQQVFGVNVVPVPPNGDDAAGFFGINYGGTLYISTDADKGFVQIAGHELLHQLRKDTPSLYHLRTESIEHKGRRLATVGGP